MIIKFVRFNHKNFSTRRDRVRKVDFFAAFGQPVWRGLAILILSARMD